jgi:hypothetical protein
MKPPPRTRKPRVPGMVRHLALLGATILATGCGGGSPLFHPAHAMPPDHVTMGAGVSSQFVAGKASDQIQAARGTMADGIVDPTESDAYVAGALSEALLAPGLAPWVGARAGLGYTSEVGLAYTAHAVRLDGRHAFEFDQLALSAGLGLHTLLVHPGSDGSASSSDAIPGLDTGSVNGFGADVPVIVGWKSDADLFQIYGGVRGGYERLGGKVRVAYGIDLQEEDPIEAERYYAGGLFGFMVAIDPFAVVLELDAAYQSGKGHIERQSPTRQRVDGRLEGFSITPGAAAIGRF